MYWHLAKSWKASTLQSTEDRKAEQRSGCDPLQLGVGSSWRRKERGMSSHLQGLFIKYFPLGASQTAAPSDILLIRLEHQYEGPRMWCCEDPGVLGITQNTPKVLKGPSKVVPGPCTQDHAVLGIEPRLILYCLTGSTVFLQVRKCLQGLLLIFPRH